MAVSFIGGGNRRTQRKPLFLSQVTDIIYVAGKKMHKKLVFYLFFLIDGIFKPCLKKFILFNEQIQLRQNNTKLSKFDTICYINYMMHFSFYDNGKKEIFIYLFAVTLIWVKAKYIHSYKINETKQADKRIIT